MSNLSSLLLDFKNNTLEQNIECLLGTLRKHLQMEVAFISEFVEGQRVFRFVDVAQEGVAVKPGASDPLETTYCKRIASGELERLIPDTDKNSVTHALPITQELSIGAYMGVPITLNNGALYGTFCCFKRDADESLNARDMAFLNVMSDIAAGMISSYLEERQDHAEILERLKQVMADDNLEIYLQPIYGLDQERVVVFEALSRFHTEPYRSPDKWFADAAAVGLGEKLEMEAIRNALIVLNKLDPQACISLNASPAYIVNGAVARTLAGADLSRIILEVTEHSPIADYTALKQALEPLRRQGMRLAIDDAGAGYASFQHILELEADVIKLDVSLTRDIHLKPKKYLLGKSLCAFAKSINCTVVAEGIECEQEYQVLAELGVDKVQGYYIGRPAPVGELALAASALVV